LVTFTYIPQCREILPAENNPVLLESAGKGLNNTNVLSIATGVKSPLDDYKYRLFRKNEFSCFDMLHKVRKYIK
jgi:hypothetical protein